MPTQLESRVPACGGVWSGGALEQFSDEDCLGLHVAPADLPNLSRFLIITIAIASQPAKVRRAVRKLPKPSPARSGV